MTHERQKAINDWLDTHCRRCVENLDRGTEFVNCQAECEVQKDVGIACIHYEEQDDYEKSIENLEHDLLYEPTYNSEDGSL